MLQKFRHNAIFQASNSAQTLKLSRCSTLIYSTWLHLTVYTSQQSTLSPSPYLLQGRATFSAGIQGSKCFVSALHIINVTAPTLHPNFSSSFQVVKNSVLSNFSEFNFKQLDVGLIKVA